MIYKLSLPKPSEQLMSFVRRYAEMEPINYSSLKWHNNIQNNEVNCAAGSFFSVPIITILAKREYQKYFTKNIIPVVGRITNTDPINVASYPPHIDKQRAIAINFYIDLGGDNVETIFYDTVDPNEIKHEGKVLPYNKVRPTNKFCLPKDNWYILDVTKFHSVENIETSRIILTISIFDRDVDDLPNILVDPTLAKKIDLE